MKSLGNILAIQTGNESSAVALKHGLSLADAGANLVLVDVKDHLDAYTSALAELMPQKDLRKLIVDHRTKQLVHMLEEADGTAEIETAAKVFDGVPFIEIIREAVKSDVGIVVKKSDGNPEEHEALLGTTDMHLVRKSPAPVWVINSARTPPQRIVVAIDAVATDELAEAFNQKIMMLAKSLADKWAADIHVVSAWHLEGEKTMLANPFLDIDESRLESLLEQAKNRVVRHQDELKGWFRRANDDGKEPDFHCIKGPARRVIPDFVDQQNADLLIIGSVSRIDIPGLLIGSTAESVLAEVNCSVVTVKPTGFQSPVITK